MVNNKKALVKSTNANFIAWNRNWVIVKRHAPLLYKPILLGSIAVLIWRFIIYDFSLGFNEKAENAILFIGLAFTFIVYAIFAGATIVEVLRDYKKISKAVVKHDMETFLLYRDEQLPILMHLLIGLISLFFVFLVMFFPYHGVNEAIALVFGVVFLVVLAYVIVTELDDYRNGIWFIEKIPPHWYEVDIEEYFKNKAQAKKSKEL